MAQFAAAVLLLVLTASTGADALTEAPGPCPDGWSDWGGKCYRYTGGSHTFAEARQLCYNDGGDLVSIGNSAENTYVASLVDEASGGLAYIGLHREDESSPWHWVDGDPLGFTSWETNNPSTSETVVVINPDNGKWQDWGTGADDFAAVCETAHLDQTPGHCHRFLDLAVECEAAGWTWLPHGLGSLRGGCYSVHNPELIGPAYDLCVANGDTRLRGGLVVVNDAAENAALFGQGGFSSSVEAHLALAQTVEAADEPAGDFVNYGGCPALYFNFHENEPDDAGGEDCVTNRVDSEWNDASCSLPQRVICEYNLRCLDDLDGDGIKDACEVPGYEFNSDTSAGLDGSVVVNLELTDPAFIDCLDRDDDDNDDVCNSNDPCPNSFPDDADGDGTCDNFDRCFGDDASGDLDGDGLCDDVDPDWDNDNTLNEDDLVCPREFPGLPDEDGDGCRDATHCSGQVVSDIKWVREWSRYVTTEPQGRPADHVLGGVDYWDLPLDRRRAIGIERPDECAEAELPEH